jgi:hypothetical protein
VFALFVVAIIGCLWHGFENEVALVALKNNPEPRPADQTFNPPNAATDGLF